MTDINTYRKTIFVLSLIMSLFLALTPDDSCAQVVSKKVVCNDRVNSSLRKYYPKYAIVTIEDLEQSAKEFYNSTYGINSKPGCVEDDFDGDGLLDYALLLRGKKKASEREMLVVLKGRTDNTFIPIILDRLVDRAGSFFIGRIPPGKIKEWEETETEKMKDLVLMHPGFELVLFEAASRVYFWDGKKFRAVQTSD